MHGYFKIKLLSILVRMAPLVSYAQQTSSPSASPCPAYRLDELSQMAYYANLSYWTTPELGLPDDAQALQIDTSVPSIAFVDPCLGLWLSPCAGR